MSPTRQQYDGFATSPATSRRLPRRMRLPQRDRRLCPSRSPALGLRIQKERPSPIRGHSETVARRRRPTRRTRTRRTDSTPLTSRSQTVRTRPFPAASPLGSGILQTRRSLRRLTVICSKPARRSTTLGTQPIQTTVRCRRAHSPGRSSFGMTRTSIPLADHLRIRRPEPCRFPRAAMTSKA